MKHSKNTHLEQQYYAFISYRRDGLDKKWANLIYKQLTSYSLKVYFKDIEESIVQLEKINADDKTIKPIFKDTEQLTAGGELTNKIKHALENSRKLIVVCSRNMKEHEYWINLEVKYFISLGHGPEDILPIIIESQIENSTPEKCFPTNLPKSWHAISILDHKLTSEDGYLAKLIMSIGNNKYRKTILSLIPNLFPTIKRSLEELWEIDKRQKITKWLLSMLLIILFTATLSISFIYVYINRTRAYEGIAMRLIDEAQIECDNRNMQQAALLLQEIKKIKNKKFIGDFSSYTNNYITTGINNFYNAADSVREFSTTPLILAQSKNKNVLAGFHPYNNIISFLDTKTLAVTDTIKIESNIIHMSISNSGKYIFTLGVNDYCVIDARTKKVIVNDNISLGQGHRTNFNPFTSTIYPYSFSKDEKFLYYISDNLYSVELSSGKKEVKEFNFNWNYPILFSPIINENKILFVDLKSAFIIDLDKNHVNSLTCISGGTNYKAELSNKTLALIQDNSSENKKTKEYDINIINIEDDKIIFHLKKNFDYKKEKDGYWNLANNFNICWIDNQLALVDSNNICLYNLEGNIYSKTKRESQGILYYIKEIDKNKLMVWDNNGIHIYSITNKEKIEYIKLSAIDNGMPLFDLFFTNDNYFFHTSYNKGSVIYCRDTMSNNKISLKGLTGISYNDTKNHIMLIYNFKHIKIIDPNNNKIIKEFDSPIFVEGCPQGIKGKDEFVMRCQTDFAIYNPKEDYLWSPLEWRTLSNKYDKIKIKTENWGPKTSFYSNSSCLYTVKSIMNYPLLTPDKNNYIEINNFRINIKNKTYTPIIGTKIDNSNFSFIKKKDTYTFINYIKQDSFKLKINEHNHIFTLNEQEKLLFVTEHSNSSWKNYLFSFSGKLLKTYNYISPSVYPINGGFIVGDLTKHGLFIIKPNMKTKNIYNIDAFAGFLYTPDRNGIFLSGTSGNNYFIDSTINKDIKKIPVLGTIYNNQTKDIQFYSNNKYLFIENVSLRKKDKTYNNVHCIIDLLDNKILIYWNERLFAPCTFTFFDDETFLYVNYNKDGTVKKYVQGELNDDFLFNWLKEYSKREISSEELSIYGIN